MSKATPTFYIFHGDDDLSIDEQVNKLKQGMGENGDLNTSEFDGESASVPEVVNAVSSYPFLADKRLVIVRGMLAHITRRGAGETGKQAVERLLEDLPHLPDYARLVFVERGELSDKDKIVKMAASAPNGYVKAFAVPKDTTSWILKRAKAEYNTEIETRAAAALSSVTGDDLRRADNELVKLVSYVGEGQPITEADVAALTPYVAEANIFKMVDAIADGRGQLALSLLHRLLAEKDQDPFSIYGMIVRQFRMLLVVREHLSTGGSTGDVGKVAGVPAFVGQNLARQSRAFSIEELEGIYRVLLDYDIKMKTGRIEPELALDLFIAGLAR